MKIQKMTKADLSAVSLLSAQLGYPIPVADIEQRFANTTNSADYGLFVAKSENSQTVGWIQINREPTSLLMEDYADVAALVVDENFRSQGVGKALLQAAEAWATENKITLIRIRSNAKRTEAQRFYLREGYEISKLSNIFLKELAL